MCLLVCCIIKPCTVFISLVVFLWWVESKLLLPSCESLFCRWPERILNSLLASLSLFFLYYFFLSFCLWSVVSMVMKKQLSLVLPVCPLPSLWSIPFSSFLFLSVLHLSQVCLIGHLLAYFPPLPPLSRWRWRPARCQVTTCQRTSWWWLGMVALGRVPSPSNFSRRSLCQTTTPR